MNRKLWVTSATAIIFLLTLSFSLMKYTFAVYASSSQQMRGEVPQQYGITRDEIIARAKAWVNAQIPYNQRGYYQGYREDCSGLVSMAWQLMTNQQPESLSTYTFPSVSHSINKDDLQPGDILLNQWGGWTTYGSPDAHVVIFDSWVDSSHTHYNAYEQSDYYGGAHYTTNMPYPYWSGYDSSDYIPMRLNSLSNTPIITVAPSAPALDFTPFVGTWYAHSQAMVIKADGIATYTGRVFTWCTDDPRPPCDTNNAGIVGGLNTQITFTSVGGNIASGTITRGTGDRDIHNNILPVGSTISVTLNTDDTLQVSDGSLLCGPTAIQNHANEGCNSGA